MSNNICYIAALRSAKFFRNGILLVSCTYERRLWVHGTTITQYYNKTPRWWDIILTSRMRFLRGSAPMTTKVYPAPSISISQYFLFKYILYHAIRMNVYDNFRNLYGNGLNRKLHFLGGDVSPTPPTRVKDILKISLCNDCSTGQM